MFQGSDRPHPIQLNLSGTDGQGQQGLTGTDNRKGKDKDKENISLLKRS